MNIGQFSKKYSVSLDTLRFYEKIKLLIPSRLSNGYRDYEFIHEQQIKFIICMKGVGFSLKEIQYALNVSKNNPSEECKGLANQLLQNKIEELNSNIKFLTQAKEQLIAITEFTQMNGAIQNQKYIVEVIDRLYSLKKDTL